MNKLKKMYYIANARLPTEKAHGIQMAKMCEALIEAGADVTLVAPRRKTASETMKHFYGLRVSVPLVYRGVIDWYGWNRFGFFVGSFLFMLSYFFYFLWKRIQGTRAILYTTDIDQFSFLLIPLLGFPYFVELHDAKKKSIAFSLLLTRACGIIVINRIIKQEIMETFGISEDRIIVQSNGVDMLQFGSFDFKKEDARKKLGISANAHVALYVGKLYGWKGIKTLVDAAEVSQDIFFYIVGGTEEELKKISGRSIIPQNIKCAGQKKYQEIPLWLWAADILLVLGTKENEYSYYHTSPMKLFEYMAARRPIIASDTLANKEIVSRNEVFFYTSDNPYDMSEKVRSLMPIIKDEIKDKESKEKYGAVIEAKLVNAYQKAESLSWENRAKTILDFIDINASK